MINTDVFSWFKKCKLVLFALFWNWSGKWPLSWINIFIISLPNWITDSQVCENTLVHNIDAFILVFGIKIEIWTCCNRILGVRLPDTILKLNNRVLDHQVDSDINLAVHSVNYSDKYLTVFFTFTFTKLLWNFLELKNIRSLIDNKWMSFINFCPLIIVCNHQLEIDLVLGLCVIGVKAYDKFFLGLELKDVIFVLFGF